MSHSPWVALPLPLLEATGAAALLSVVSTASFESETVGLLRGGAMKHRRVQMTQHLILPHRDGQVECLGEQESLTLLRQTWRVVVVTVRRVWCM